LSEEMAWPVCMHPVESMSETVNSDKRTHREVFIRRKCLTVLPEPGNSESPDDDQKLNSDSNSQTVA
jgi:hypothetical protein